MMATIKDIIYDALTEKGYDVDFQDGGLIVSADEDTQMAVIDFKDVRKTKEIIEMR